MLHNTKGIVLRSIKYGETSLVLSVYTEKFGLQSYLVNGVRSTAKANTKANSFQVTTVLDMIVYHHPHKNLQRIKESKVKWNVQSASYNVVQYSVCIFMIEIIQKTIIDTEPNEELFHFFIQSITQLATTNIANKAILFLIEYSGQLGYAIQNNYSTETPCFSIQEGYFVSEKMQSHTNVIDKNISCNISQFINPTQSDIQISNAQRLEITSTFIRFFQIHQPHITELKSLPILHELLHS